MRIALDVDNTITYAPQFFSRFTELFKEDEIIVVTVREDLEETESLLKENGIRYDRLILASDPEFGMDSPQDFWLWKAKVFESLHVDIVFEDTPEIIPHIKPPTKAFLLCDEVICEWISHSLDPEDSEEA